MKAPGPGPGPTKTTGAGSKLRTDFCQFSTTQVSNNMFRQVLEQMEATLLNESCLFFE